MLSTSTARRWQSRLGWPIILSTVWLVMYTSLVSFNSAFSDPEESESGFLFSPEHPTHPLGWLFLLTLSVTLVGVVFKTYILAAGH